MSVKICSIGDIMLGENLHHYKRSIASLFQHNYNRLVHSSVNSIINQADILIGNLECTFMPDYDYQNASFIRSIYAAPKSSLNCFGKWEPAIVFNVANNHFGQHGKAAMDYTLRCLEERGIYFVGRTRTPIEITIKGRSVSIWGVTIVNDEYNYDGYFKSSAEDLLSDLSCGDKPDGAFWIVSIHWGEEYLTIPSATQKKLAMSLYKKGVDLILGHHSHVIQPVRYVNDIPVAYSHGNFIFDQNFSKLTQLGLMMITELDSKDFLLYVLKSKNFRIVSSTCISIDALEEFCDKNMFRYYPLVMRFLMKLELLSKGYDVPKSVWHYFFHSCFKKIVKLIKK